MASMREPLSRFVSIIVPIAEVYSLSVAFLHIFYDVGGGPIAFNREGSLFLNLRYFEAWRKCDQYMNCRMLYFRQMIRMSRMVSNNKRKYHGLLLLDHSHRRVLTGQLSHSRFFTIAHEIAHNLVKPHNSEHAFWFSAICEAHVSNFVQILDPMAYI